MLLQQLNLGLYRAAEAVLSPLMGKARFHRIPVFVAIMLTCAAIGALVGKVMALVFTSSHHLALIGSIIGLFAGLLSTGAELLHEL